MDKGECCVVLCAFQNQVTSLNLLFWDDFCGPEKDLGCYIVIDGKASI